MSESVKKILFIISGILTLIGVIFYIFSVKQEYAPYIYSVGCAGVAVVYLTSIYRGPNVRLRRLHAFLTISGILLVASSYFMFHNRSEWIICLIISTFLQLYASFSAPKNEE